MSAQPPRRQRTRAELEAELAKQLGFLRRSASAFDSGDRSEAVRLATGIRVLLHESRTSHSLLEQLGKKSGDFVDSAFAIPVVAQSPGFCGLAVIDTDSKGYHAQLDEMPSRLLPFPKWWGAPVLTDHHGSFLTRESLVTIAANQDGGAHVDPDLDDRYAAMTRDNALGWIRQTAAGAEPLGDPVGPSIRQIAHEVLKTLVPGYSCAPKKRTGMIFQGFITLNATPRPMKPPRYDEHGWQLPEKLEPTDPCFCGSQQELQHCHGVPKI